MTRLIRQYAQDKAGFSLAELMVVIALIGIMSAIALPNLLGNLPEKRLKNAARNLYSDMQRARLQAVKLNKTVTAAFNDGKTYNLAFIDNKGVPTTIKTGSLTEYGDVTFGCPGMTDWNGNAANAPTGNLSFTKTGTANLGTANPIFLGSNNVNACYAVEVTQFGAVKIRWQHNGGSWN